MENVHQQMVHEGEEELRDEPSAEALQLVKSEERLQEAEAEAEQQQQQHLQQQQHQQQQHQQQLQQQHQQQLQQQQQIEMREEAPQSMSVITRRGRTITAAGHITEDELGDDGVKDEPPEAPPGDEPPHSHAPPTQSMSHYAPKLEESMEHHAHAHYEEERMRLSEAETARYLAFKQEPPYRALPSPLPTPHSPSPGARSQLPRPRPPPGPFGRGLALRYGPPHHVIVQQDGDDEHGPDAYLAHKERVEQAQYASADADGRQYAAALGEQATAALEMIQTTSLNDQQSVGVAYQPVKYETRGGESEARAGTYASLQPVTSVGGGYTYATSGGQYTGAYGYGGGKELLALYGAAGGVGGTGERRGDDSPPSQLLYRADPTLSSSSLGPRAAHVVYGSVVPQSQAVYETPPSPNSQQVGNLFITLKPH